MSDCFAPSSITKGISAFLPPPGFPPRASFNEKNVTPRAAEEKKLLTKPQRLDKDLEAIMISDKYTKIFKDLIASLHKSELKTMASMITSNADDFTNIVTTKNGSKRVQHLLGKSDEIQTFFHDAIIRSFFKLMTDKYALYVPVTAMRLFNDEKKIALHEETLRHALDLARDEHGCIALNQIITDVDDVYYRFRLRDLIARNAFDLSKDEYGNFVVQHALLLNDMRCKSKIVSHLKGHYAELSFNKYGSYIVEKLLEEEEEEEEGLMVQVAEELALECNGETLMRMARHEYGNFVVAKALLVTQEVSRFDLFCTLCKKLMPFLHLLLKSRSSRRVVAILEA